ncbi:MAG: hypothetical protein ACRDI3_01505, partial [Actinomycetota bacterium]
PTPDRRFGSVIKQRSTVAIAVALVLSITPMNATRADTTVGGDTVRAGNCDVFLPSVTIDDEGHVKRISIGSIDCPRI